MVRPGVIAVVKADAYAWGPRRGRGCRCGMSLVCRGHPDEALELRDEGITEPILVLGPSPERSVGEYVRRDITATVTDLSFARALGCEALRRGKRVPVHVKVDSGMGRIGFLPEEVPGVLEELVAMEGLRIEGMFTHFACADEMRLDYTKRQFAGLRTALLAAERLGIPIPLRHACNSAGILACPDMYLGGVRPGIILYGMWPSGECPRTMELLPTFEVKTEVALVRELPPGSGVGYGLRYMTRGVERIAVLPVGYADGYSRALSSKVQVLIGGKRVPLAGNICMDQTMANVTGMDVKAGDRWSSWDARGTRRSPRRDRGPSEHHQLRGPHLLLETGAQGLPVRRSPGTPLLHGGRGTPFAEGRRRRSGIMMEERDPSPPLLPDSV